MRSQTGAVLTSMGKGGQGAGHPPQRNEQGRAALSGERGLSHLFILEVISHA